MGWSNGGVTRVTLGALSVFAASAFAAFPAHADVMNVTVWQGNGSGSIADPDEQALPSNPLKLHVPIASFNYTGDIQWNVGTQSLNFLDTFVGTGGGSVSNCVGSGCASSSALGHVSLSSSGFDLTTLFEIVFTTNGPVSGSIAHDDGASIFDGSDTVSFLNSAFPTAEIVDNFSLPSAGTYDLWYIEANSAPSVLSISPAISS